MNNEALQAAKTLGLTEAGRFENMHGELFVILADSYAVTYLIGDETGWELVTVDYVLTQWVLHQTEREMIQGLRLQAIEDQKNKKA